MATSALCFLPVAFVPSKFSVPLKPFVPSLAILATIHLIFSLGWEAHLLFFVWQMLGIVVYWTYSMHHTSKNSQVDVDGIGIGAVGDGVNLVAENAVASDAVLKDDDFVLE